MYVPYLNFVYEDDRHDNAVNRRRFAEDNANQVLGPDTRRFDGRTHDARARQKDAPPCSKNREAQGEPNSKVGPSKGRHMREDFRPSRITEIVYAVHVVGS